MDIWREVVLAASAAIAGAVNSIAGGGTVISFPAAVAAGLPAVCANATNAVALAPGSLLAAWGFRKEVARHRRLTLELLLPAVLGALSGSVLLQHTPVKVFEAAVPWLVLVSTLLMLLKRRVVPRTAGVVRPRRSRALLYASQFAVGVYGGYFGAAMGIVMLASLAYFCELEIHDANGVKNALSGSINGVAALYFLVSGMVDGAAAAVMALGASVGGVLGARLALSVRPAVVRGMVVGIGFVLTALLAYRHYR